MNYDRAYSEVILSRWDKTPKEQQDRAKRLPNRQGRLRPDDPGSYALYDTYNYQRGHADVFREVYRECLETDAPSPLLKGERLLVVDIGAGAATVAVAFSEVLDRNELQQVDYLAFDPHPMMRELGTHVLEHLGSGFRTARYVDSLEDIDFADADRLLFALSYVVHQPSVEQTDLVVWRNLIRQVLDQVDGSVELIYTTEARRDAKGGAHLTLRDMLDEARILGNTEPIDVQVPHRFPDETRNDGRVCWDKRGGMQQVLAEHWTLRK